MLEISILSVLPDRAQAEKMQETVKADFDITADEDGRLMDLLGLRHKGGNPVNGTDLPRAASFLIDARGKVFWSKVAENYRVRPDPEKVLAVAEGYFAGCSLKNSEPNSK